MLRKIIFSCAVNNCIANVRIYLEDSEFRIAKQSPYSLTHCESLEKPIEAIIVFFLQINQTKNCYSLCKCSKKNINRNLNKILIRL
jgi:hypothetical protein